MLHNCGPACAEGCQCCWVTVLLQIFRISCTARLLGEGLPVLPFLKSPAAILMQFFQTHRCPALLSLPRTLPSCPAVSFRYRLWKSRPHFKALGSAASLQHSIYILSLHQRDTVHIKYHCSYCCLHNSPHIQAPSDCYL